MIHIKLFTLFITLFLQASVAYASQPSPQDILPVIKACADIGKFNPTDYDTNYLMRRVLYTYRNFEIITASAPDAHTANNLKLCRTDFIKEAVYNAFRITAPTPSAEQLTQQGYCESNGYYYFTGGYTQYFATEAIEIVKTIPLNDNTLFVIFSDIYYEAGKEPIFEYSSAYLGYDSDGYYIRSISMGEAEHNYAVDTDNNSVAPLRLLPVFIAVIALTSALFVFYIFILRR